MMPARKSTAPKLEKNKSLESWIWDAACSIRGAKDAPKYKDFILPLIFTKRLCDVFDDELNRIAAEVGSRKKAFQLAKRDHKLVRFFLPLEPADPEQPVWSVIRKLSDKIGEGVTSHMRAIAKENPPVQGIIDRVDFNATTHGQRDIDDDRLSNLIEKISEKRLGLEFKEWGHSCPQANGKKKNGYSKVATPLKLYGQDQWAWGAHLRRAQRARRVRLRRKQPNQCNPTTWRLAAMNMAIRGIDFGKEPADTFTRDQHLDLAISKSELRMWN